MSKSNLSVNAECFIPSSRKSVKPCEPPSVLTNSVSLYASSVDGALINSSVTPHSVSQKKKKIKKAQTSNKESMLKTDLKINQVNKPEFRTYSSILNSKPLGKNMLISTINEKNHKLVINKEKEIEDDSSKTIEKERFLAHKSSKSSTNQQQASPWITILSRSKKIENNNEIFGINSKKGCFKNDIHMTKRNKSTNDLSESNQFKNLTQAMTKNIAKNSFKLDSLKINYKERDCEQKKMSKGNINVFRKSNKPNEIQKIKQKKLIDQPIMLDFSKMLELSSKKSIVESSSKKDTKVKTPKKGPNFLDSSSVIKRGKEKEFPKSKKITSLRKVILKDRMLRKSKFLQNLGLLETRSLERLQEQFDLPTCLEEFLKFFGGRLIRGCGKFLESIIQTPGVDLYAAALIYDDVQKILFPSTNFSLSHLRNFHPQVVDSIHSRKFREYCNQVLNTEIDTCCANFLKDLIRYQDQQHHKDAVKALMKRRLVYGLREVIKYLKINKIKCVIISPNVEKGPSQGGLDEKIEQIIMMCKENQVPFVFAMNRKQLGKTCLKKVPVSVVGIINYEGAENHFSNLKLLADDARAKYDDMITQLNQEIMNLEIYDSVDDVHKCGSDNDHIGEINI